MYFLVYSVHFYVCFGNFDWLGSRWRQFTFIEFGPCPIYAHGSSFSPIAGIMMIMMVMIIVVGAEIIIIIHRRHINYYNYECNPDCGLNL